MKKRFLSLFLMAVLCCVGQMAWADTVYELFKNGEINADYFYTTGTVESGTWVVGTTNYTKGVKLGDNAKTISGVNNPNRIIQYDARTTNTQIEFVVINTSTTSKRNVYYTVIESGATTCTPETLAVAKSGSVSETRTSTSTKNRSFYFSVDNKDDVRILAIKITEKGDSIPMAGEAGYSINFDKARLVAKSGTAAFIDGMKLVINASYSALTNKDAFVPLRNDGQMIKFYVPKKVKLTVGVHSAGASDCPFYVYPTYGTRTDKANKNIAVAGQTYDYELEGGKDWFIYTGSGKTVNFGSLAFSSLSVTVDPPTNYAIDSATSVITFDEVADCTYKFEMLDGEDAVITLDNVTSGTTITRPFLKGGSFTTNLYAVKQGSSSEPATATWKLADLSTPAEDLPQSEYCGFTLGSGTSQIGMNWETDEDGNINISAVGVGASWRSTGFKGMSYFKVANMPASLYFEEVYSTGDDVYQLRLKDGKKIALGEKIYFNGTAQWMINGAGNYYANYSFAYTYGANCPESGLDTPTNLAIDATNKLTFTGDEDATSFTAVIYYDDNMVDNLTVEPAGTVLPRPMLTGATYQVTVIANGEGGTMSDESDPINWVLADDPQQVTGSEYCSYEFGSGNAVAMMSWETDEDGNVVITIEGENNPTWRGTAFKGMNYFTVGKLSASYFFEEDYTQGAPTYTLRKKTGVNLVEGETITFKGTMQWKNDLATNAYLENQTLPYSYGGICVGLDKPVITNIDADKKITFVGDEDADYFVANVTLNGVGVHVQTVASGDTINFVPRLTGDYKVTVTAKAEGLSDSDPSDEYTWSLNAVPYTPAASEVCVYALDAIANLSMTTDEDNVVITIAGDNATVFRTNTPLDLGSFKAGTAPASNFFNAELIDNKTYQLTLKQGAELGQGTAINYSGTIRWITSDNDNAYKSDNFSMTYGNTCVDNAPVLTVSGNSQTCTSVQLTMAAVDDHEANITYTISRAGANNVVATGASGETKNVVIDGLESNVEYTFSIVASDGANVCEAQEVKVTPLCDEEAPNNLSLIAVASSETSIKVTMSATDNFEGNLIYNLYMDGTLKVENQVKLSGVEWVADIDGLEEAQSYAFYFTVRDLAGNSSTSDTVPATTFSAADNIAYHKLATAGSAEGLHGAAFAVDGNMATYWGNYGKVAFDEHNNWLAVDLCGTYSVNRVNITWQHFPDYAGFVLQAKVADGEWQTVFTHEGDKYQGGQTQVIDFATPVQATDLRVFSEGATQTWYMAISELKAFGEGAVQINEDADNSARIAAMEGLTTDVKLSRAFTAGTKATFCVPFDMNEEQVDAAFGDAAIYDLTDAYWKSEGALYINFNKVQTIAAGTPYIIIPAQDFAANTVIEDVTVSAASVSRGNELVSFYGVTSATQIEAGKYVFSSADSYLYKASAGTIRGLRGYFELNLTPAQQAAMRSCRAVFNDKQVVTDLEEQSTISNQQSKMIIDGQLIIIRDGKMYNAQGARL